MGNTSDDEQKRLSIYIKAFENWNRNCRLLILRGYIL